MKCFMQWINDLPSEQHTKDVYQRDRPDGEREAKPGKEGFPGILHGAPWV